MVPIILGVLPLLIVVSSLVMYRFNGRREIFRMDMTQFLYTFIMGPVAFVWMKNFLFFLLRDELNLRLSVGEYLTIDTLFSVFFLYIYAFVVIHSLTKSLYISTEKKDDVYEFFAKSEFFHMDFSHYGIYLGTILFGVLLGFANLIFPFATDTQIFTKSTFYGILLCSLIAGMLAHISLYLYQSESAHFLKLIKFFLGLSFLVLALGYIILAPSFNSLYIVYWCVLSVIVSMVALSLFSEQKRERGRLPFRLNFKKIKTVKDIIVSS